MSSVDDDVLRDSWSGEDEALRAPRPRANVPGEPGLWVFILGDMSVFALFFTVFAKESRQDSGLFAAGAGELHVSIGVANTLILLLSSYLVVGGLHAGRTGDVARMRRLLAGATACAAGFAALKAVEWSLEVHAGHTPATNPFFTFYYVLCGVHLLHVAIGGALLTAWRRSGGAGLFAECAAVYWHMVDLLWVIIFALLYVAVAA